jgi:glycosyltransferase involved in cell wall biosynthesis
MDDRPRYLHVVPKVIRHGAEVFAAQLAEALNREHGSRNVLFPLFGPPEGEPAAPVRVVPGARPISSIERTTGADPGAVARMRYGLKRLKPDLVVAHGGEPLKYAVLADPRNRIPVVYRRIGYRASTRGERTLAWMMSRAEAVLAVSEGMRDELVDRFDIEPSRVEVIPTARREPPRLTPAEIEAFRASIEVKPDVPLIAWVGRLAVERQPGVALQVFALVRSRFGPCSIALCGDGPLRGQVERAAAVAGEGARVLGSRDDADRLIAASDILLSTSDTEGALGVLVESGLAGIPAVAFDVADVSQVVKDGETGVLAPAGFLEAMGVVVLDLLRNPERREQMGASARKWCRQYRVETVAERYADVFARAVAAR